MAFTSDFIWVKSLSQQLFSFKLFISLVNFLMVNSNDNNLFHIWNFNIKLFHLLGFTTELAFGSPKSRRTNRKRNIKINFPVFLGISLIRNFCFSSFIKKNVKLKRASSTMCIIDIQCRKYMQNLSASFSFKPVLHYKNYR